MKAVTLAPSNRLQIVASLLVLIGSVCFAAKAVIVKLAYRYDIDPVSLLALRMLFSVPFFLVIAWNARQKAIANKEPALTRKDWLQIIGLGLLGYYLASLFDFWGLEYISAGLERLILFTYPTIVVIISALVLGKRINGMQILALVLTYLGIAVAFLDHLFHDTNSNFLLGGLLIFISALVFAIYLTGGSNIIPKFGTQRFTALALTAASVAILLQHGIMYQWRLFHYAPQVYGLAFLMAIISTVLPSFMVSEGLRVIRPAIPPLSAVFLPLLLSFLPEYF